MVALGWFRKNITENIWLQLGPQIKDGRKEHEGWGKTFHEKVVNDEKSMFYYSWYVRFKESQEENEEDRKVKLNHVCQDKNVNIP